MEQSITYIRKEVNICLRQTQYFKLQQLNFLTKIKLYNERRILEFCKCTAKLNTIVRPVNFRIKPQF